MNRFILRNRRAQSSGFTLVELLVVIGIIAILAAVSLGVGSVVIKSAKRAKAANTAIQIQTACMSYYTEYSIYPIPTSPAATASQDYSLTDSSAAANALGWKGLIWALTGGTNNPYDASTTAPTSAAPNTRLIAFLTLKSTDVDVNGGPINPLPPSTLKPYFNIVIDNDYDNVIGDTGAVQCIDFSTGTTTTDPTAFTAPKGPSGGIAVWANCNGSTSLHNPNFWVHTY